MQRDDCIRLHHMLDAARDAVGFARDKKREGLDSDRQLVMAVVKCVEIIGEAASQVSAETRDTIPSLPWGDMINMRHRLVHAYYDINLNVVWATIQEDLPSLIKALEAIPDLN
ncbi:MAG: DUF86 domain-containing protein [Phycisphaerae bacterium]|nr:DUF86 domain-containing protein [Phycisphaerae bacterium]